MTALKLVEGSGPIFFEQFGQDAVGQKLASGLAVRTIVAFGLRINDPLNRGVADQTRFPIASVYCHTLTKSGYLLRELTSCFGSESADPVLKNGLRSVE